MKHVLTIWQRKRPDYFLPVDNFLPLGAIVTFTIGTGKHTEGIEFKVKELIYRVHQKRLLIVIEPNSESELNGDAVQKYLENEWYKELYLNFILLFPSPVRKFFREIRITLDRLNA